jgi:MoxR-like ATPase
MSKKVLLDEFKEMCDFLYPGKNELTRKEIQNVAAEYNCNIPSKVWDNKVHGEGRSVFYLLNAVVDENVFEVSQQPTKKKVTSAYCYDSYIPKKNEYFVSHGTNYKLIDTVVKEREFFPMYVYGVSGLGKTFQIEQSCASHKRPFFRCQITKDTTNEDLIGCYSLVDGNTVWMDGPVLMAYRSGGVLLLDEIDLNSSLMILQVVLENKPIYITQTGELVYPQKGFTVFATGNSKGDGSDGRFVGTTVLNDAFLERFVTIIEQKIPSKSVEEKIIKRYLELENVNLSNSLYEEFVKWIEYVRESYKSEATDVYISTRRIQYILKVYKITGENNLTKSMEVALSRYSDEDRDGFMKVWKAIHKEDA